MEEIQQFFTIWVGNAADLIPLGYAFGAGMVSAVNPCGFAMLPAYLGLYLGSQSALAPAYAGTMQGNGTVGISTIPTQVAKAFFVTTVVTAGFVAVFAGVGSLIAAGSRVIVAWMPWIALSIGGALVLLGVAMLRGTHLSAAFTARLAARLGDPRTTNMKGYFVFGLAFAAASLSCTLPIFLTVVASALAVSGLAVAAVNFVSYALGMGLIILVLTIGIAVFRSAFLGAFRRGVAYIEHVIPLLLVAAGSYIVYYWLFKGDLIDTFA